MDMAMKVEELSMEPRELTVGELEDVSAGFFAVAALIVAFGVGYTGGLIFGSWLARRLN